MLDEEHHFGSAISGGLKSTEKHLQNKSVGGKQAAGIDHATVNNFFIRRAITDWMIEWIRIAIRGANEKDPMNTILRQT